MKFKLMTAALLSLLVAAASAYAQSRPQQQPTPAPTPQSAQPTPAPASQKPADSEAKRKYDALLASAKKGDQPVDYKALRFAFFETPEFSPLSGMFVYRGLWGVVAQSDWAEAVKQAEAVLEKNHVDANAHMVAYIAYRQQGNEEKAKYHRRWADGLLDSIRSGGDGKSPATAWHVISISEEYAVLRSMNLRAVGQSLVRDGNHAYDQMKVVDPETKAEATYFFNVDKPFSAYGRK